MYTIHTQLLSALIVVKRINLLSLTRVGEGLASTLLLPELLLRCCLLLLLLLTHDVTLADVPCAC